MTTESTNTSALRVGFVGLGVMGGAMCRNIIRRQRFASVTFIDPDREAVEAVAIVGGRPAIDLADLASSSDVIVLSLPDGDVSDQVINEFLPLARVGQLLIDTSTIPVHVAQRHAQRCAAARVSYVDAPVARTREAAEAGTLSTMVGGSAEAVALARPLLECIASDITHCGPAGNGEAVKILNNMILFQVVNALSEAMAIASRAGVPPELLAQVLEKGSADSFALRHHGRKSLIPGVYPERAFSTSYARKDNAYALSLARQMGVSARGALLMDQIFGDAVDAGYSQHYFPVIHRLHGLQ